MSFYEAKMRTGADESRPAGPIGGMDMDMTEEEKVKAYRMRVFDKFTWGQIARVLFPEAWNAAPDLCELLLHETVRHWYESDPEAPAKCWSGDAEVVSAAR